MLRTRCWLINECGATLTPKSSTSTVAAASIYPKHIIVRLSDFKPNGYESLTDGEEFGPTEENPMLGFRNCGRYTDRFFKECFASDLEILKLVQMGLGNVEINDARVCALWTWPRMSTKCWRIALKCREDGLKVNTRLSCQATSS